MSHRQLSFLPPDERPVRQERTGWRDEEISLRHRKWGFNCPAVDLDWVVVEYNSARLVAFVEYKHYRARNPNLTHPTYVALQRAADDLGLPFFVSFYWPETWAFLVKPVNDIAVTHFGNPEPFSERGYVRRLYKFRNLAITDHILAPLNTELPPADDYRMRGAA